MKSQPAFVMRHFSANDNLFTEYYISKVEIVQTRTDATDTIRKVNTIKWNKAEGELLSLLMSLQTKSEK